jgi:transposase-like protein
MSEAKKEIKCRGCGSTNVRKAGLVILASPFRKAQNYQCKDCGRHFYIDPYYEEAKTE